MPASEMPYGLIRKLSNAFWVEFYCERVLRSAGFAPDDRAQRDFHKPRFALNYCRSGDIRRPYGGFNCLTSKRNFALVFALNGEAHNGFEYFLCPPSITRAPFALKSSE